MTENNFRHGDLALIEIDMLPPGLGVEKKDGVIYMGKTSAHRVTDGVFYDKQVDEWVIGYLKAKKHCTLWHRDHGEPTNEKEKPATIPIGLYEVRRQTERTHEGMRPVED